MMHASCSFCKADCSSHVNLITILPVSDPMASEPPTLQDIPTHLHLCDDCLRKFLSGTAIRNTDQDDPQEQPQMEPETPVQPVAKEPEDPYQTVYGMELADFLRTALWLNTQNMVFRNTEGSPIRDFRPWLKRRVIHIGQPDRETHQIPVVLKKYSRQKNPLPAVFLR